MKETRFIMGMPVTIEIADRYALIKDINNAFSLLSSIDEKFSTYKETSEITMLNKKKLSLKNVSEEMRTIFILSENTRKETEGYFNIFHNGVYDPSGIVKGWGIQKASDLLRVRGINNFYIDVGGDIQVSGKNMQGELWKIGIRNPFNRKEVIKVLVIDNEGVATSGTSIRGQHIYNPHAPDKQITEIVSITVIAPNIYEADRFATAAFAMGIKGISFIESLSGFEAYVIDKTGTAFYTTGFNQYVIQ